MSNNRPSTALSLLRRTFAVLSNTDDSIDLNENNGWIAMKENPEPPSYDDYDPFKQLEISNRYVSTTKVIHSLLKYSFDVNVVGKSLWEQLIASPSWDKKGSSPGKMIRIATPGDWYTGKVVLERRHTLAQFADAIAKNKELKKIIFAWANRYWMNLLIPMVQCGSVAPPEPHSLGPTPVTANSSYDLSNVESPSLTLRKELIARDGYISAIGYATDESSRSILARRRSTVKKLVTTHIIPYSAYRNQNLLEMLEEYSGERFPHRFLNMDGITTDPCNAFLLDPICAEKFAEFSFSLDVPMNSPNYVIRYFTPSLPVQFELNNPNGSAVEFGRGVDKEIQRPSGLLLQVHCSLARVLHASGAVEVINQVMKEEMLVKESAADGMSWGPIGDAYIMRKLQEAAFTQDPHIYDSDEEGEQEGEDDEWEDDDQS